MDHITSLNRLTEILKQSNAEDYVKIAKNMNIPVSDFKNYAHWKKDGYARNCIIKTAAFELILICWKEGDSTPIHGHNNQKCWVYLVDGNMTEIRYQKDENGNLLPYELRVTKFGGFLDVSNYLQAEFHSFCGVS